MSETPITNGQSPVTGSNISSGDRSDITSRQSQGDDEISVLDLLIILAKHKWLVLGLPFVAVILAIIYSLLLPSIYTAITKILPPHQSQSPAAAMLGQLGAVTGLAGVSRFTKDPNDLYIGMLKSRTVADNLIQRFDLKKRYEQHYLSSTRQALGSSTVITSGKDGIISVEVDDKDPKFAAELANAYIDELFKLTKVLAVTEAAQRRLFFEQQFAQAKDSLAKAEATARQALDQGGLVKVDDQGRAMVETTARLRAQMSVKEVQIGAMRTFAADRNPDLRLAQQELESMKRELAKIEGTGGVKASESVSGGKGIDNLRLLRDLKYYETIYELLSKQYELAKIDEAKDSAVIQVMDKAIEPDRKSKPKRSQIVLIAALAALFVGILWAFVREAMAKARSNPQQAARYQALKRYLAWR
jgi:uncharacterized protein involved in exopolysaccharide biosynthesis